MRLTITKTALLFILPFILCFAPEGEWTGFESKPDGFKVLFPGAVTTQSQKIPSAIGELEMKLFTVQTGVAHTNDNIIYMVMTTAYPADKVNSTDTSIWDALFRNSIDGGVANAKGKLITEKKISLGKYPGREVKSEVDNDGNGVPEILNARFYLIENKLFVLQVLCFKEKDGNASITRFWNSFAVL